MKNYYYFLAVLLSGLLCVSCSGKKKSDSNGEETQKEKNDRTEMVIPDGLKTRESDLYKKDTEGVKKYFADNHINADDRKALKIDDIKYTRLNVGDTETEETNEYLHEALAKASDDNIVKGKILDEIEKGKLQVIYMLYERSGEYLVAEYFVTYDKDGNYIDSKLVANFLPSIDTEVSYTTQNNTLNVGYDSGGESWSEDYKIASDLKIDKVANNGTPFE